MTTVKTRVDGQTTITIPSFNARALREAFRSRSLPVLAPLFAKAHDPAKEWTESWAALHKLRRWHKTPTRVLHVGDGAHARTAALFAFHTKHDNVSIDPQANIAAVAGWAHDAGVMVERLAMRRGRAEDSVRAEAVNCWEIYRQPLLLTFVHAHVNTEKILSLIPPGLWRAAYVSACCEPLAQLVPATSKVASIVEQGEDWSILSPERTYQVLVPKEVA